MSTSQVAESESAPPKPPLPTTRYCWKTLNPVIKQHYITDAQHAEQAMSCFTGPCGLDIEWRPTYVKGQAENPVALLQLANTDTILLLHLHHIRAIPPSLRAFLENPEIVKAGVGIQGDAKKLYKDIGLSVRGCVDLALLARSVDNERWKGKYSDPLGLARLIATYEDLLLFKGKVTRSNWERRLDAEQLEYASNDSHAGYTLFMRLSQLLLSLSKIPEPRCYSFDCQRGSLVVPSTGTPWTPFNPDYDPGPPPPPKEPKTKKERSPKPTTDTDASRLRLPVQTGSKPSHRPGQSSFRARNTQRPAPSHPSLPPKPPPAAGGRPRPAKYHPELPRNRKLNTVDTAE
ncbi:3'-5' exonuclease domain-containing protein [Mycena indigotica]|uniref:3'-5' exonuclease n=1 Tax=Mycena indigotica TaxID=2126181 RepID=A0A8H6SVF0_9AGAR|nr:3'-5' exonuclease domain-containing protein [Mycena indigotica]KAF7306628.1 3'-5' exonuclease domain-containing protein [Mycena indigotica]